MNFENDSPLSGSGMDPDTMMQAWEDRHKLITRGISRFIYDYERMPTNTELAAETNLSRQIVTAHLEDMAAHQSYHTEMETVRIMTSRVLAKLLSMAMHGDLGAARLYFKVMKKQFPKPANAETAREPFYAIGLNNIWLFDYMIDRLSQENKDTIENILKGPAKESEDGEPDWLAGNKIWENNHTAIVRAISILMNEHGRVPGTAEIAAQTELSRQTVAKHLETFTSHPLYREEIEQFRSQSKDVLAIVSNHALNGNMKAIKLYLHIVTEMNAHPDQKPLEYECCLLVNRTKFDQAKIDRLTQQQRDEIFNIVRPDYKKPEWMK